MTTESLDELRDRLLGEERVQRMVRARAYEIYQMRGGQPGWDSHDWFQAEGEVLAFLIAHESPGQDERYSAEPTQPASAPQAPATSEATATRKSRPLATSKATVAKEAATKKAPQKMAASKKPESKSKADRTSKSSKKEKSNK